MPNQDLSSLFDANYYQTGLGPPYERNAHWLNFFGTIADEIVRSLKPKTVFDAGCGLGFLVESLWDRGVEARGIDISAFAISQVRRDMQPYCREGSITDPIEGRYDLLTCIEVLEHLVPEQTEIAIANLAAASDTILFSSTPIDLSEATHFNVRPVINWLNLFAKVGFAPDCIFDAGFVAPHAILFRKQAALSDEILVLFSEKTRLKCAFAERGQRLVDLNQTIAELTSSAAECQQVREENARLVVELDALRGKYSAVSNELVNLRDQATRERLALVSEAQSAQAAKVKSESAAETVRRELSAKQTTFNGLTSELAKERKETERVQRQFTGVLSNLALASAELVRLRLQQELTPLRTLVSTGLKELWLAVTFRRSGRLREPRELMRSLEIVSNSWFFDAAWYLETYPDVAAAGKNPLLHYLERGAREGRNPGPNFDAKSYLDQYPDVAATGRNPLLHYLEFGAKEGREVRPVAKQSDAAESEMLRLSELVAASSFFNAVWYRETYPDVAEANIDPVLHYLEHGAYEGRNPGPDFDTKSYLERYPDVAERGFNPLVHYLQFGAKEGREARPTTPPTEQVTSVEENKDPELVRRYELVAASSLFDAKWYLETYPDVAAAGQDPIWHYLERGAAEGRNPGPNFDGNWYLKRNADVSAAGLNPLLHYLEYGAPENRAIRPSEYTRTVDQLLRNHFPALSLHTFPEPAAPGRITIVTDSINAGHLYGGVGTALILSTLLAKRIDTNLRVVTRNEPAEAGNVNHILSVNDITWERDIEFLFAPVDGSRHVAVSDNDVFLTTSWWTTKAVRTVINPARIFYLLQEDERMFYPYGDERLRCEEMLQDSEIHFVVNSELLFEHLTTGTEALDNIRRAGMWFEPAFPASNYFPEQATNSTHKKQFLFYARPNNLRNLYWRGIEAIGAALESGVFRSDEWEFNFVGHGIEPVVLPGEANLTIHQNLPWSEYARLVRQINVALCLMDTPHASYPPLDLAASGAIVVTNRRGIKTSLARYSENILCSDPSVEALKAGLATAVTIATDDSVRLAKYSRNRLLRDWKVALSPVVERLAELICSKE